MNHQEPSTHTQQATASPSRVCESRFDEKVRREYARNLASQKFIRNPDGYAISIADGRADSMIQEWIDSKSARAVEARPDPDCDYCKGTGTMRLGDDGRPIPYCLNVDSLEAETANFDSCICRRGEGGNGKGDAQASDQRGTATSEREQIKPRRRKRNVERER